MGIDFNVHILNLFFITKLKLIYLILDDSLLGLSMALYIVMQALSLIITDI